MVTPRMDSRRRRRSGLRRRRHRLRLFARRATGCVHWSFRANAGVRTAPTVGQGTAQPIPRSTSATSSAMSTPSTPKPARQVWKERHRHASRSRGSPARPTWRTGGSTCRCRRSKNRARAIPAIHAARFVVASRAYDAAHRQAALEILYRGRATDAREDHVEGHATCGRRPEPGVWSSPTVDLQRGAVYVATGNGYTEPADEPRTR